MGWRDTLDHYVELDRTYCAEMTALNEADAEMNAATLANFTELVRVLPTIKAAPQWAAAIRHIASQPYTTQAADLIDYARKAIVKAEREGKK